MSIKAVFRENWLTAKPSPAAVPVTIGLVVLLAAGYFGAPEATGNLVFQKREYWRAWTTLLVHGDAGHLFSNLVLFIPFAYFLTGYFSFLFFPLLGFLLGGFMNLMVLKTLPPMVALVGVSGVVYWMGAAWVTLSFLIDRRERTGKRALKSLGVSMLLFLPQVYRPEVSYLTHFLGYGMGVTSALVYYAIRRRRFRSAEKYDYHYDFDAHWDPRINGYPEEFPVVTDPTESR